jgi:type I restriction enzyme S subunit
MSSKTKTTATIEETTLALVPKLRFPAFREVEWVQKKLEDVAPLQRGFDLPSDLIRPGDIPIVYSNGIQKYHEVGMATAPGLVTGRSGTIGKLHFIEHGEYWPHNTSLWVTDFKGNAPRFVYYLYSSIGMGRFSSGSGVPTLNRNDVHAFSAPIPNSTAEQQKIAECLSSVDELIAAQARKLDALKTHKKGLMQQLFPREGETQPRLRFPEFQNAGEWAEKPLGELVELQSGFAFSSSSFGREGRKLVTPKNFTKFGRGNFDESVSKYTTEEVPERFVCKPGDLLVLLTDLTPTCELLGKPLLLEEEDGTVLLNQRVVRVEVVSPKLAPLFLKYVFLSEAYSTLIIKTATGSTVKHSSNKVLAEMVLFHPSTAEQQRIADCLTSLDDLITAQTQTLEALKTHKQGLMQQLFPMGENAPFSY